MGQKVEAEDRSNIESAASALEEALKGDDAESIKKAMQTLEEASHKLAEAMYKQAGDAAAAAPGAAPASDQPAEEKKDDAGDDVIDAEYEVKEWHGWAR